MTKAKRSKRPAATKKGASRKAASEKKAASGKKAAAGKKPASTKKATAGKKPASTQKAVAKKPARKKTAARKKAATVRARGKKPAAGAAARTRRAAGAPEVTSGAPGVSSVAPGASSRAAFAPMPRLEPIEAPEATCFGLVDEDGAPRVKKVLAEARIDAAGLRQIFRTMIRVRALDERMMRLQRQGRVGFYGACTGQEAVPIATAEALEASDWIFPALREGPAMLHRGFDLVKYVCQIYGNAGDVLKGRQMPSHMSDRGVHQVSWSSVIGPQISQAVGVAYAARLKGDPTVAVAFMGDGATSSNDFHTGLNFAGVWQVPVIFICQNNHWSISVPTAQQTASATIAQKALAYGLPGYRVDGNDALAVHRAVNEAADRARRGGGPSFIECVTYRIGAHSSSDDPRVYRDEGEVDVWRARDPVDRLRAFLKSTRSLTDAEEQAWIDAAREEVAAAVKAAESMGPPDLDTLFGDVYANAPWHLREQAEAMREAMEREEG
jgi:pyruvate dehydrogenase E1 component alpha subunit